MPEYAADAEHVNPLGYNAAWTAVGCSAGLSVMEEGPSREARRGWAEDLPDRYVNDIILFCCDRLYRLTMQCDVCTFKSSTFDSYGWRREGSSPCT